MKFKRTKVIATACMLSLTLSVSGVPAVAFAEPTSALQQRVNEAYATLQEYTMQLELANGQLASVKADLASVQDEIAQTRKDIEEKKAEIAEGQEIIAQRVSSNYKRGSANILSIILHSADFSDLFSRAFYANKVADADAEVIAQVKTDMAVLEQKQADLAEQEARQKELVSAQEAKTAEVSTRANQQQSYYNGLDSQLKDQLAQEAARKAAEEAARQQALQQQQQQQQNQQNQQGGATDGNNDSSTSKPSKPAEKPSNNGNTNSGNAPSSVVSVALAQVGKPYVWAATGPNAFDCSGLTSYCYAQLGFGLPRTAQAQFNSVRAKGHLVYNVGNLKPGDLIFWGNGGSASSIYHVGMYIGGGQYVHASMPGIGVVTASLYTGGNYVGGGSPV